MGLDGVELVLSVEDEFGIGIDDADAANLTTPRILADYVITRLGHVGTIKGRCLSQGGFYRIRSVLVRMFGASRKDVRPDSSIRDFLNGNIRRQWIELKNAIGATQLPGLQCKKSVAYPLIFGIPLAGTTLLFLGGAPAWALILMSFVLWISATIVADKMGDVVPENLCTIGTLVPYVRVQNQEEWTRDYVLQRVLQITATQFGIPIEKIVRAP
jgi:hypothetical protein